MSEDSIVTNQNAKVALSKAKDEIKKSERNTIDLSYCSLESILSKICNLTYSSDKKL